MQVQFLGQEDPLEAWQPTPVFLSAESHREACWAIQSIGLQQTHQSNLAHAHTFNKYVLSSTVSVSLEKPA